MAGTEDAEGAADDALYVLTAVLLTPAQFPSVLGDDYPEACAALGLEPYAQGYGLVLGQDGTGARWTVVVDDVSLVAVAIASWDCGMEYDLSPDENSVVSALPGWPLAVATRAPELPEPHDPEPEEDDRAPLTPPDTHAWGPAQRRLGADEVAQQWTAWREQVGGHEPVEGAEAPATARADDAPSGEDQGPDEAEVPVDEGAGAPGPGKHEGVLRVLRQLRLYALTPPPTGRVRSSFASGGARMLRADGPGWSLVARTDDMAFVLLDDEPGEVLPVGRGPELPGLLEALDQIAVRPS
ncbi:hypothetical protein ABT160_22775 [Streptomyces sp. NPDC001941]|uniref:hypothetical protein n=1 Tax=Streptomyces sp. NPDC001941 TaxID=3154659 RepID=UPI0033189968